MKPWCAEGDVPTAASLNLYRGRSSYVGWHSDDEPLFGKRGKAYVSVSFGNQALFKWKGKSCQTMTVTRAGLAMVTLRIPVRIRNGLTSRDVGSNNVSLRGAPLALPACATAQFRAFFDRGRIVRCTLLLGAGRIMHLVVLYGYQGADSDPEQLALTDQLFDAALGELSVVAGGQPCM